MRPALAAPGGRRTAAPDGRPWCASVNSDSTRRRAASPSRRASSGSRRSRITASARASGSLGGTRRPVSPSTTSSGLPPTRVATTGRPAAMASSRALDMPSSTEDRTNTSKRGRSRAALGTAPRKRTPPLRPRRAPGPRGTERSGPSPTMMSLAEGSSRRIEGRRLQQLLVPALPDEPRDGAHDLVVGLHPERLGRVRWATAAGRGGRVNPVGNDHDLLQGTALGRVHVVADGPGHGGHAVGEAVDEASMPTDRGPAGRRPCCACSRWRRGLRPAAR